MRRPGTCGRIGVLIGLLALSACDRDDGDTTVADEKGGERDADPIADACADLECDADHVCVVPGLYCDRSGPEPVLTRDAPYCAPLAAPRSGGGHLDDRTRDPVVQALCPTPDVILSDDGRDGTILHCPGLDVDTECE
ncbi:MAG: hypothetical protein R3B09_16705 [Nannocystaceae bacterium]